MANRVKEDERNERIIRNLLKLPDNRRCINCNSLGPQYVCTNFWTFVCTNCSGIHREFTHRVKSVSMAKFTSQEVSALQGGGNARAKDIYFKEWDPQRHSVPDSSQVERLRDVIKHVYVDRRYAGERSFDKPPRVKMGETGDYENRRIDTYQGGSRSPPYEDEYERRYNDRPSPGGRSDDKNYRNNYDARRSPGYEQENRQRGDYRSPARSGIVNDWQREDRFVNGRRSEDSRSSDGGSKLEIMSPDRQKDLDMSSPPMVRPVRDILGDNLSPLRIEPPKANDGKAAEGSVRTQRTASSSSLASSNGNPAELRRENSGILIDFDAVTEPTVTVAMPQTQQTASGQPNSQRTNPSNVDNWACFDSATEVKVSEATASVNSLESVLSQLSVSAPVPGHMAGNNFMSASAFGNGASSAATVNNFMTLPPGGAPAVAPLGHTSPSSFGSVAPAATPVNNLMAFPPVGAPAAAPGSASVFPINGVNSFFKVADNEQWPGMHPQQHSNFLATGSQSSAQPSTPPLGGAQPWNSSLASNTRGLSSITSAQASQAISKPTPEVASAVVTQLSPVGVKPTGRTELPEDLFHATCSPPFVPLPGWQTGPPHGFGFTMPYNTAMPMPTFLQSSKSTNPFDLTNETAPVQAPSFPPMASYPSAMPPQSSYPSAMPSQALAPSYALATPPSAYMGQQVPNSPSRQQVAVGFGSGGAAFGSLSSNQQLSGIYSAAATPNALSSVGGNPFG
ncbi:probable ADP-ribosylation factor GTPase-activating protein AGD14 isoform X2 [Cornus florida]|uniref:probable ADP-ribosylation factor GTPase-activating protein AGD14 isoform X2 n=1 Tax=Cornus florida TaxID=4283 RepID=UPI00289C5D2C|nr:probable ADP-ribosylation factor GTPase-activating protein AGD14 isoform X2 [Cornus florida]